MTAFQKTAELLDEIRTLKESNGRFQVESKSLSEKCSELQMIGNDLKARNEDLGARAAKLEGELRNAGKTCDERETSISELSSKASYQSRQNQIPAIFTTSNLFLGSQAGTLAYAHIFEFRYLVKQDLYSASGIYCDYRYAPRKLDRKSNVGEHRTANF